MTWDFIITVSGTNPFSDNLDDLFHDVGCYDATIAVQQGRIRLYFSRCADTLENAIKTAVTQIRSLGVTIVDVYFEP